MIIFELPHFSKTSGGIMCTIALAEKMQAHVRFQHLTEYPVINTEWTVGEPDLTFPPCDVCITYSDNPKAYKLLQLPQIKRVVILMLSYGMAISREQPNIYLPITVLCSSKKIEMDILKDGIKAHRIGINIDMSDMYLEDKRENLLSILYHSSPSKNYELAVRVADNLYERGLIDGVIVFGMNWGNAVHPKGLVQYYPNATRSQVREVFNRSKVFLMPSSTEGVSFTPIESTLCGCPAVICDGAEELFDNETCFKVPCDELVLTSQCEFAVNNFDKYSEKFRLNMLERTKEHTSENVINNLKKLI